MSAHDDEAERAAEDGGPRAFPWPPRVYVGQAREQDTTAARMQGAIDHVERIQDAVIITPRFAGRVERDELGDETRAMLEDRIMRSALYYGHEYKGQRLPYEPRSGPVFKTDAQQREEAFEHELEALQERYWIELGGDYYVNARTCCVCGLAAEHGKRHCKTHLAVMPEPRYYGG